MKHLLWSIVLLAGCFELPENPDEPVVVVASTVEVTVPTDGLNLEGTLHLPERFDGDRVAAVVLVHGSGPNGRDEAAPGQLNMAFGLTVEVFVDLAEALQDAGYAVLRYDKRTCGPFNGLCSNGYPTPEPDVSVHDFVNDAIAALTWLGAQEAVDPAGLAVIGHSQGAEFPPAILDGGYADLGISLAGPWRDINELIRFQLDSSVALLEAAGQTPQQIDDAVADLRVMADDLDALAAGTFVGDAIAGAPAAFWQSWLDVSADRRAAAPTVASRLLAVNGDYDWNVPPVELEGWAGAGVETLEVPCATHALNCISQPDWTAITPADIGGGVDEAVIDGVLEFLDDL